MNPYSQLCRKCKIVMLGYSGVGKSTLIKRICSNEFDEGLLSNVSAEISTIRRESKVNKGPIDFLLIDTAGQEVFHSMTKDYIREAHYALLCFNPMKEKYLESINYWTEFLREVEGNTKICLVATFADQYHDNGEFRHKLSKNINAFSDKFSCNIVSSLTGEGVAELFEPIVDDFDSTNELQDNTSQIIITEEKRSTTLKDCC